MPIELFELSIVVILIATLVILYVIFDTIKRVKGQFHRGWRVLFMAMAMFFVVEVIELLEALNYIEGGLFEEILEIIFVLIILFSVVIINKKVKEVHDGHKKLKYRAKKK